MKLHDPAQLRQKENCGVGKDLNSIASNSLENEGKPTELSCFFLKASSDRKPLNVRKIRFTSPLESRGKYLPQNMVQFTVALNSPGLFQRLLENHTLSILFAVSSTV